MFSQLGTITEHASKLHLKGDLEPRFRRPRPLPFVLKTAVKAELDWLLSLGIIEPVNYCEWVAPIAKQDGKLCLCSDYNVMINSVLNVDQYLLPNADELFTSLSGWSTFTVFDLTKAYQQLLLDEELQKLVTINTHRGLYRYAYSPNCHLEWHQLLPCFKISLMSSFKCYRCYRQRTLPQSRRSFEMTETSQYNCETV